MGDFTLSEVEYRPLMEMNLGKESDSKLMLRMRLMIAGAIVLGVALMLRLMTIRPDTGSNASSPAPNIALPLKKGEPPVRLSQLRGQVVLLDFWATWCGPCRQSIPELVNLQAKFGKEGLKVIGISVDEENTRDRVPSMIEELGINYPVVLYPEVPDILDKYPFESLPTLFVIDKKGNVRGKVTGYNPNSHLEPYIVTLLEE